MYYSCRYISIMSVLSFRTCNISFVWLLLQFFLWYFKRKSWIKSSVNVNIYHNIYSDMIIGLESHAPLPMWAESTGAPARWHLNPSADRISNVLGILWWMKSQVYSACLKLLAASFGVSASVGRVFFYPENKYEIKKKRKK